MRIRRAFSTAFFAVVLVPFFSCASLVDKTGALLDGSAFAQKIFASYSSSENPDVTISLAHNKGSGDDIVVLIEHKRFPNLLFHGKVVAPNGGGDFDTAAKSRFALTHYTFFCSGVYGWNEFSMDISASGTFEKISPPDTRGKKKGTARISFDGNIETVGISSGKIRRGDGRMTGEQAVTALRNRRERIAAVVEWMRAYNFDGEITASPVFESQKAFAAYWKPILMPELSPKKKRTARYNSPKSVAWEKGGAEWVFAEDVYWNKTYTALIFPEYLCPVRDSGALLRDWEESVSWIYLAYSWQEVIESL
jgi:hypothetical protein